MQFLNSALKIWLRLQCQMITNTSAGVLVRHNAVRDRVVARWPRPDAVDAVMLEAAKDVVKKKRLHLRSVDQELLLGQPIVIDGQFWGAVVLRISKRETLDLEATLKLLKWGMTWLQFALYQHQVTEHGGQSAAILELLGSSLKQASLDELSIGLVNQLATRLKADRVSFGLCEKRSVTLLAVSFSANFDRRTPSMQAVADAMLEAVEQQMDIHYAPEGVESADYPVRIEVADESSPPGLIVRSHEHLQQLSRAAALHTFLLRRDRRTVAVLTLEINQAEPLAPEEKKWIEQCLSLLTPVICLRLAATKSFWSRLKVSVLAFMHRWFGYHHLRGKVMGAVVVLACLLLLMPSDYWIYSDAILENTNKHMVVSPQDGYLGVINARPGDKVRKQTVLAQLDNNDLTLERRKLVSQLQQFQQEYDSALAKSERSQAAIANARVEQATLQLRLLEQQLARITLTAPIDGTIVSDDIRQSQGAPVKQGDILFEIASDDGYLVQLYVDERDITAIEREQSGRLVLTSLPGKVFDFTVTHITPLSEIRDGRNYFRVEATLTGGEALVRPGMTGSGKVLVGRRSLGWIWFHDIWHWLRLTLWL